MTQALRKLVTFNEFVAQYPDNTQRRYELHDGVIVEMAQPTGDHEEVRGFLIRKLSVEFDRLNLLYLIPKTVFVKPLENESAYSPDVLILNQPNLINEPLWKKASTVSQAASIPFCSPIRAQRSHSGVYDFLCEICHFMQSIICTHQFRSTRYQKHISN